MECAVACGMCGGLWSFSLSRFLSPFLSTFPLSLLLSLFLSFCLFLFLYFSLSLSLSFIILFYSFLPSPMSLRSFFRVSDAISATVLFIRRHLDHFMLVCLLYIVIVLVQASAVDCPVLHAAVAQAFAAVARQKQSLVAHSRHGTPPHSEQGVTSRRT